MKKNVAYYQQSIMNEITKEYTTRDIANAMNLITPEIPDHHQRVGYFAYVMADEMGYDDADKLAVIYVEHGERQAVGNFIYAALFPVVFSYRLSINKSDDGISCAKAAFDCHVGIVACFQFFRKSGQDFC